MRFFRRSVSLLLSLILILSVFAIVPFTVNAAPPSGGGGGIDIGGGGNNSGSSSWSTTPTAKENLVYNGTPQELINGGTPSQGNEVTAKYHLGAYESTWKNWSSAIPTATDAGTYTVWYAIDGGSNYADFEPQSLTVTIAEPAVLVFASKWLSAENVTGKYYRFSDLYANVIFVRANPEETFGYSLNAGTSGLWNRSGNLTLDNNKFVVNSWDDGYGHSLGGYWGEDSGHSNDGYIYLSDELNSATADWYAYTWETFEVDSTVDATAPTYSANANPPYQNGNIKYYTVGSRYFKEISGTTDNHQNVQQVSADDVLVPYFEFEEISGTENVKLVKCNSADADIIIPDTVPSNYPDSTLRGKNITVIKGGAFLNNTTVETVTMGNNITSIAQDDINNQYPAEGAFQGCTNLESVSVGNSLTSVNANAFQGCTSFVSFTTTSEHNGNFAGINKVGLVIRCKHNSELARTANSDYSGVTVEYIDASFSHAFNATWHWDDFGTDGTVTADILCITCGMRETGISATISQVEDTPATDEAAGSGHYLATVEYNNQTFTDTDGGIHTYTIPRLPHTHTDANNQTITFEPWTSSTSLPTSGSYFLTCNVTVSSTTTVSDTLNLCLNGHGVLMTGNGSVFFVPSNTTMNLYDCNGSDSEHYVTLTNWRGTAVSDSGTEAAVTNGSGVVKVTGGFITGGFAGNPGGGAIKVNGTFTMYGGTLIGNFAQYDTTKGSGGAIWSNGSTTIAGNSRIMYNKSTEGDRGGVYISGGYFYISGAPDLRGNSGRDLVMNNNGLIRFIDYDPDVRIGVIYYTQNPSEIVITSNAGFADNDELNAIMQHSQNNRAIVRGANGQARIVAIYTVTWNNWNGDNLETDTGLLYNEAVSFDGATPTRPEDTRYTYTFTGWTDDHGYYYADGLGLPGAVRDVTYTATYTPVQKPIFYKNALALEGEIGLIYYIDVTRAGITNDDIKNGSKTLSVSFSWAEADPPYSDPSKYNVIINKDNYSTYLVDDPGNVCDGTFKVKCDVCVAEMTCMVKADAVICSGSDAIYSESKNYSVRDYCMTVIGSDPNTFAHQDELVALCKHMLNYGAQAQIEFGIKTTDLANAGVTLDDSEIVNVDWSSVPDPYVDINGLLSTYGLKYEGSSLIYLDKTTLRHYFTVEDAGLYSGVTSFKIGDKTVTPFKRSTYVCIERSDIAAAELDDQYSITVNNTSYGIYGAMNYSAVAAWTPVTEQNEKDLANATYCYNKAADAYFNAVHPQP